MRIDGAKLDRAAEMVGRALESATDDRGLGIVVASVAPSQLRRAVLGALTILTGHDCIASDEMRLSGFDLLKQPEGST